MSPVTNPVARTPIVESTPDTGRVITLVPKPKKAKAQKIPTGYYRRKGGDVWYYRRKIDGVQINESTGFTDLEKARRRGAELEAAQREGDLGWTTQKMPTLRQYFAETPEVNLRVKDFVDAIDPHGKVRLNHVTKDLCRKWMIERLKAHTKYDRPFTPGTVRVECAIIKAWLQHVVGHKQLLRENPWKGIKLPKKSVKKRYLRSGDEETRLFDVLTTFDAEIVRAVRILIGSGLRISEFLGTRPRDVQHATIGVRGEVAKGGYSRNVPIHATVVEHVEAQREARGLEPFSTDPLFTMTASSLAKRLKRACVLAGIEQLTPHDLRRTYGTRMAFKVPAKVLQLLMGHKQISTTFEHYNVAEECTLGALVEAAGQIV